MSIEWFIYLASIITGIDSFLFVISAIGITGGLGVLGMGFTENEPELRRAAKPIILIGVFAAFLDILIPSERTMYMIAGAHYGKEAMQTETAQKVAKLLNGKLDEELAKLTNEKPAP